jgi:hypothetical protein
LDSVCAIILRAGSRTLSTWNSCMCHPWIILAQGWSSIVESWPYKTIVFTGSPEEFTWILLQERGTFF